MIVWFGYVNTKLNHIKCHSVQSLAITLLSYLSPASHWRATRRVNYEIINFAKSLNVATAATKERRNPTPIIVFNCERYR